MDSLIKLVPDIIESDKQIEKSVLEFVDLLFPYFPETIHFQIWQAIGNHQTFNGLNYSSSVIIQLLEAEDLISNFIIENGLGEKEPNSCRMILTESGIEYKKNIMKFKNTMPEDLSGLTEVKKSEISFSEGIIWIIVLIVLGLLLIILGKVI
jgi:hypothetical protein